MANPIKICLIIFLAGICSCSMSHTPQKVSTPHKELKVSKSAIELREQSQDQTNNGTSNTATSQKHGISPVFTDSLEPAQSLHSAWVNAFLKLSEGAWMQLALRMAESDFSLIPKAIELIESVQKYGNSTLLEDAYGFHLARMWSRYAEEVSAEEAKNARANAIRECSRVLKHRKSPYYHEARALKLRNELRDGINVQEELAKFIEDYPNYPGILKLKFEYNVNEYALGKTESAVWHIQDLAFFNTWSSVGQEAAQWLQTNGYADRKRSFDDTFEKVDKLRKMRFWDEAETAATQAMKDFPESYQLAVQHARIAYERSDHEEALNRFLKILERLDGQVKDNLRPAGVIAYIARAYAYMGDCKKAIEYYRRNVSNFGKRDRAEAIMNFALACGALDVAYENAKIAYQSPKGENAYRYALIAYINNDFETARSYFNISLDGLTGSSKRRSSYYLAQATLKSAQAGNSQPAPAPENSSSKNKKKKKTTPALPKATVESAKKQFQTIIDLDSTDYYAILAWSRLEEINGSVPAQTPVIQTFPQQVTQKDDVVRPWEQEFTFSEKTSLSSLEENIERYKSLFPALERVAFFHDAGLYRERNKEFRPIAIEAIGISRMKGKPSFANLWTAKLSVDGHLVDNRRKKTGVWGTDLNTFHFDLPPKQDKEARQNEVQRQQQIYENASEITDFIKRTLPAFHDYYLTRKYTPAPSRTCGSTDLQETCSKLYPHAFSHHVIRSSREQHITPDVIWAVMNIESAFNPDSISFADAFGLLQIIPMTGYKIASALHDTEFGPYDLIRPEYSISMGTWYFSQILHKFHGYATLSMAAYNGGPHQVARWLTAYAGKLDHDAFVDLIPYNEARHYVKKGMARLLVFHRTDKQNPNAFFYIPNTLPESFEIMPNY